MAMSKEERRELNKSSQKKWYQKNKEYTIEKQREKRWAMKKWFEEEILAKCKCEKCGENHPAVLDFHHKDPSEKEGNVGLMVYQKYSKKRTLAEIAKCQVLCANCHRRHHWDERREDESFRK